MDNRKAIEILNKYEYSTRLELSEGIKNHACDNITIDDFFKMKELATIAISKQIPQCITKEVNESIVCYCPVCNRLEWDVSSLGNYCVSCGQRLK